LQQTKRTRRGSKNKDEVDSFIYLKNSLITLFETPDSLHLVKQRILQILQFWNSQGKVSRVDDICGAFSSCFVSFLFCLSLVRQFELNDLLLFSL
jgi:hypothetical protein